ncbi:MAG: pilus assembly protein [Peptococcaceae bacterium]|nr:pilus assembly protein [Peptococcaceae bacterium]
MRKRGAIATEVAITLPLIVFMGVSVMTLILTGWAKIITTDAAREAARHVALNLGTAQEKVEEVITDGHLKVANIKKVDVIENTNYVTVTVEYDQPTIVPGLPVIFGQSPWDDHFHLSSTSVFKKEKP